MHWSWKWDCKAAKSDEKAARFRTFYQLCVNLDCSELRTELFSSEERYLMNSNSRHDDAGMRYILNLMGKFVATQSAGRDLGRMGKLVVASSRVTSKPVRHGLLHVGKNL